LPLWKAAQAFIIAIRKEMKSAFRNLCAWRNEKEESGIEGTELILTISLS
jgi:hypothetical protein